MATETLEDNNPPLHDDDSLAKPQPNDAILDETKARSKETPKKSKKSKKEAASEKKDPVTPASERPTRETKTVERFSVPSPLSLEGPLLLKVSQLRRDVARSSRISQMKGKKRSRKSAPSKSPGEASTETPAKVLIDKWVKPSNAIIDYNTSYRLKVPFEGDTTIREWT